MLFKSILALSLATLALASPQFGQGGGQNGGGQNGGGQNGGGQNGGGQNGGGQNGGGQNGGGQNGGGGRPGASSSTCRPTTITRFSNGNGNGATSTVTTTRTITVGGGNGGGNGPAPTSSANIIYIAGFNSNSCINDGSRRGPNDPYLRAITIPTNTGNGGRGTCQSFDDPISSLSFNAFPQNLATPSNCRLYLYSDQQCGANNGENWSLSLATGTRNTCQQSSFQNALSARVECN